MPDDKKLGSMTREKAIKTLSSLEDWGDLVFRIDMDETMINAPRDGLNQQAYQFLSAQKNDDPEARYYVGLFYEKYKGFSKDLVVPADCPRSDYAFAAEKGFAPAQRRMGQYALDAEDIRKAHQLFQLAAAQNEPRALFELGRIYRDGVPPYKADLDQALDYLEKAARHGSDQAYEAAAFILLDHGDLSDERIKKQIKTKLQIAANAGLMNAQIRYAEALMNEGDDLAENDFDGALYHLQKAWSQHQSLEALELIRTLGMEIKEQINQTELSAEFLNAAEGLGGLYLRVITVLKQADLDEPDDQRAVVSQAEIESLLGRTA